MVVSPAQAESGVASDAPASTQISPVTIATTGAAVDIMDALKGVLIESSVVVLDTVTAAAAIVTAIAQSLPPTDAPSAVYSTPQPIAESGAASSTQSALVQARARLDVAIDSSDSWGGTWTAKVNLSQNLAAADVLQVLSTAFLGAIQQSASPSDILTAKTTLPAQLTAALAGIDVVTGIALVNLIETRTATDVVAASAGFFRALLEQAPPGVTLVASARYAPAIAEALVALGVTDAFITLTGLGIVVVSNRARYSAAVSTRPTHEDD